MNFKQYLESINACQEAIDWAGGKTLDEAWQTCDRPDWMLWLYGRNNPDKVMCVKIAVFAARLVLPLWQEKYPDDLRPQQAIGASEKWIENPSEENMAAAAAAARSAARAAEAAEAAAWAAAEAAEAAAAGAAAAGAAAAAEAARAVARAARAAAMAAEAARDNVNKTIADYVRTLIPTINIKGVDNEHK